MLTTGLPASPGAASGQVVFDPDEAAERAGARRAGDPGAARDLARRTSTGWWPRADPHRARRDDLARGGGGARDGQVLRGGRERAARWTRPTAASRGRHGGRARATGSPWTARTGRVHPRARCPRWSRSSRTSFQRADGVGRRAAAPAGARQRGHARATRRGRAAFGAEGIGLCRTEHMFFEGDRITAVREMILARTRGRPARGAGEAPADAARGLRGDLPRHGRAAGDDPPAGPAAARVPARRARRRSRTWPQRHAGWTRRGCARAVEQHHEANPMLGHRGVRLGITYPGDHRDAGAGDLRGGGRRERGGRGGASRRS